MNDSPKILRMRIVIRGAVQGVGFRPFIYRLALELNLLGWVLNSSQGVFIEVEASHEKLNNFLLRIQKEKPAIAYIQSLESSFLDVIGYPDFQIKESSDSEDKTVIIMPDIATCDKCIEEIFDPASRRYLYPFTNCTNCGPRYSIIKALPYDRPNTTMKDFTMCPECAAEYQNPEDRRFHAQPNACSACGPYVSLLDQEGKVLATYQEALEKTSQAIKQGKIVAVKGLGGFHLMVLASNEEAVKDIRLKKDRQAKPFALMYAGIDDIKKDCELSELEQRLLESPEAPIVMVKKRKDSKLSELIAPNNPYLGVMIASTPLHHILLRMVDSPVIATSGNLKDETICFKEEEVVEYLKDIADLFLVHNRLIQRHADDSIVRIFADREIIMRRARGYAPLPITLKKNIPSSRLAVGGHLKNTIAVSVKNNVMISPHIGDLDTEQSFQTFKNIIGEFKDLYNLKIRFVCHDLHPAYNSTKFANNTGLPFVAVQHHYAHILSCMAENQIEAPVLGVAWDGAGYGLDKTIWGSEFLKITDKSFERLAWLEPFYLVGGEAAVRQPRRIAMGLLYELFGDELFEMNDIASVQSFSTNELKNLKTMLDKNINSPLTSSMGRLFDGVASILGICQYTEFEGQPAMGLEFAASAAETEDIFTASISIIENETLETQYVINSVMLIEEILIDIRLGIDKNIIAAKFHNTLVEIIVAIADKAGIEKVALSGGCFQNKYLTERTIERLQEENFKPYWHQRVPPNDGGISLGQIVAANRNS